MYRSPSLRPDIKDTKSTSRSTMHMVEKSAGPNESKEISTEIAAVKTGLQAS